MSKQLFVRTGLLQIRSVSVKYSEWTLHYSKSYNSKIPLTRTIFLVPWRHISEVKPLCLNDDTERYSWSRIKTLNYAYSVG